jgi:hypothetical protein
VVSFDYDASRVRAGIRGCLVAHTLLLQIFAAVCAIRGVPTALISYPTCAICAIFTIVPFVPVTGLRGLNQLATCWCNIIRPGGLHRCVYAHRHSCTDVIKKLLGSPLSSSRCNYKVVGKSTEHLKSVEMMCNAQIDQLTVNSLNGIPSTVGQR